MMLVIAVLSVIAMFVFVMGVLDLAYGRRRATAQRVGRRMENLLRALSDVDWLHRALAAQSWTKQMDLALEQAQVRATLGVLLLASVLGAASCFLVMHLLVDNLFLLVVPPLALGYAPFMWVQRKRDARMGRFQRQLPDALDLIARALKAGHAFNQGMRMVADEFADPIGPEFQKTLDEINFGIPADAALHNLTRRVDCPDLKFFVVSVNIQRETGGNLAEIVTNIARLIREPGCACFRPKAA